MRHARAGAARDASDLEHTDTDTDMDTEEATCTARGSDETEQKQKQRQRQKRHARDAPIARRCASHLLEIPERYPLADLRRFQREMTFPISASAIVPSRLLWSVRQ